MPCAQGWKRRLKSLALVVAAVPALLAVEAALRNHLEALLARGAADA